jgi:Rrf2 family protein
MNLSKRSEYGLRALFDLAGHPPDRPVPLRELAATNRLPVKFLEQIFVTLRNAGIVHSQTGPGGGYTLARQPGSITLGEVIRALDGRLAPVGCLSQVDYEPCSCPDERNCLLRKAMTPVRQAIVDVVDRTSLADVNGRRKGSHSR